MVPEGGRGLSLWGLCQPRDPRPRDPDCAQGTYDSCGHKGHPVKFRKAAPQNPGSGPFDRKARVPPVAAEEERLPL